MNYAVVRGADTRWGNSFARVLASSKSNLILLGSNSEKLDVLAREVRQLNLVSMHCFPVNESDTSAILAVCDHLNAWFTIDLLINYSDGSSFVDFQDVHVNNLINILTKNVLASPIYAHQLLPNLTLCANAAILELQDPSVAAIFDSFQIPERSCIPRCSLPSFSGIHTVSDQLPWTNTANVPDRVFRKIARETLGKLQSHYDPETV